MKTYYLMIARTFPATHPRKKMQTRFVQAIWDDIKKHTIRLNYHLWLKRSIEINAGRAILSLRYWEGLPYRSKQIEFHRLNKIGIEKLDISLTISPIDTLKMEIANKPSAIKAYQLAENDGLSLNDFFHWFFPKRKDTIHQAAIIHFTDFRYIS